VGAATSGPAASGQKARLVGGKRGRITGRKEKKPKEGPATGKREKKISPKKEAFQKEKLRTTHGEKS